VGQGIAGKGRAHGEPERRAYADDPLRQHVVECEQDIAGNGQQDCADDVSARDRRECGSASAGRNSCARWLSERHAIVPTAATRATTENPDQPGAGRHRQRPRGKDRERVNPVHPGVIPISHQHHDVRSKNSVRRGYWRVAGGDRAASTEAETSSR
jgi:hypothetical protein